MAEGIDPRAAGSTRCASCGGELLWDAKRKTNRCPYCGSSIEAASEAPPLEKPLAKGLEDAAKAKPDPGERHIRCKQCGAITHWRAEKRAGRCAFCASPALIEEAETEGRLKPDGVVPFAIDKKEAAKRAKAWFGKKWFRPSNLKKAASLDGLQGIYLPFWSFDVRARASYTGERGSFHNRSVGMGRTGAALNQAHRQVSWTSASGEVDRFFDDLLLCGGQGLPTEYLGRVADWGTNQALPYEDRYLQGFVAEDYSMGLEQAWERAKGSMAQALRSDCARAMGGDTHRNIAVELDLDEQQYKLCLVPAWLGLYRYGGKVYRIVINGQTGRVAGRSPMSHFKVGFWLAAAALAMAMLWLIAQ